MPWYFLPRYFVCVWLVVGLGVRPLAHGAGRSDSVRELERAVSRVADRAIPAVVLIHVDRVEVLAPSLQEVVQEYHLRIRPGYRPKGKASGSGVVVSPAGRVITNAHVVDGAREVMLVFSDQRRLPARVLGVDPRTDLALLQIEEPGSYSWLPLGRSDDLRVGDLVVAVGNPFEFQSTVTLGIVSARGRRGLGDHEIQDYIQTDAAVNPGSSGGPLLDLNGEIVGINAAIYAPVAEQDSGISFAIPSSLVRRVVEDLERGGRIPRSWLGLVTRSVEEVDGDPTRYGTEVLRVIPDSPAEGAGFRRGDVIVRAGEEPIDSSEALRTLVLVRAIGSEESFEVVRDGRHRDLVAVLGEERDVGVGLDDLPDDALHWDGLYLADPTDDLRAHFGLGAGRGVLVVRVDPDSAGERLGIKTGDLVVSLGGSPVTGLDWVRSTLSEAAHGVVVLQIQRGGRRAFSVMPISGR